VSYEFVLGLLNSKLANWFYRMRFTNGSKLTVNLSKEYVGQIPVRLTNEKARQTIAATAAKILAAKRKNPDADVTDLEISMNRHVYDLYELTPEEIALVEGG
jgi:hypothetical protein